MKFFKLLSVIFIVITLFVASFKATPVKAQQAVDDSAAIQNFNTSLEDGKYSSEDYTFINTNYLIQSLGGVISGIPNAKSPFLQSGAINTTGTMVAFLYANPPASGVTYFADTFKHFGIVQPAYAQTGTGFDALHPLIELWRGVRNFTYLFFVVILAGTGIAVMFRMRLSPQAVITIQSALPRVVIALILVTFSYAIAGLLIDFMYVAISLVALIFAGAANVNVAGLQEQFTRGNFFDVLGGLLGLVNPQSAAQAGANCFGGWIPGWICNVGSTVTKMTPSGMISSFVSNLMNKGIWQATGEAVLGSSLAKLIFGLIILYVLFKLFFELLQTYIAIVLLVIIGPLQIALGVIPGFPGFGSWFKSLLGNLMVFVGVAFVLMIGNILVLSANTAQLWRAPLLAGSGLIADNMPSIIALGILLVVHQIPAAVKSAFGIKGLGIFNPAQAWGATAGPLATGGRTAGFEYGMQRIEGPAIAAGTTTGWRVGASRVARNLTRIGRSPF